MSQKIEEIQRDHILKDLHEAQHLIYNFRGSLRDAGHTYAPYNDIVKIQQLLDRATRSLTDHDRSIAARDAPRMTPAQLSKAVVSVLSNDLRQPRFLNQVTGGQHNRNRLGRQMAMMTGYCYVASEALFHLLGGKKAGWVPQHIVHEITSHWYLRHKDTGEVLDPTAAQFKAPVPYEHGKGKGFLTKKPSRRARVVITRVKKNRRG